MLIDMHNHSIEGLRDSKVSAMVGLCATEFQDDIGSMDDLVKAVKARRVRQLYLSELAFIQEWAPRQMLLESNVARLCGK